MFGVVFLDLLYVFLTKSGRKSSVLSIMQTSPNLSNLTLIVVWLQMCPDRFCHGHCLLEIKNIIPDPLRYVRPPEARINHTLAKSCCLIHHLFPTNLLSFQDLVNFGILCLPLPFLNPTTYLASNPPLTNLTSSFYLVNFPFSFYSFVRALV